MELTGKIIAEFNERGGVSNRTGNEWKAKSYVMEVPGDFPRKFVFDVFGTERLQAFNIQIGELLTVYFDIDAHEYNGRWFNDVRAFRIDRGQAAPSPCKKAPQLLHLKLLPKPRQHPKHRSLPCPQWTQHPSRHPRQQTTCHFKQFIILNS